MIFFRPSCSQICPFLANELLMPSLPQTSSFLRVWWVLTFRPLRGIFMAWLLI